MKDGEMIIYHTDDGKAAVTLMSRNGSVWLTQKQMAELYGVSVPNISMLIAKIIKEGELEPDSVIKSQFGNAARIRAAFLVEELHNAA